MLPHPLYGKVMSQVAHAAMFRAAKALTAKNPHFSRTHCQCNQELGCKDRWTASTTKQIDLRCTRKRGPPSCVFFVIFVECGIAYGVDSRVKLRPQSCYGLVREGRTTEELDQYSAVGITMPPPPPQVGRARSRVIRQLCTLSRKNI